MNYNVPKDIYIFHLILQGFPSSLVLSIKSAIKNRCGGVFLHNRQNLLSVATVICWQYLAGSCNFLCEVAQNFEMLKTHVFFHLILLIISSSLVFSIKNSGWNSIFVEETITENYITIFNVFKNVNETHNQTFRPLGKPLEIQYINLVQLLSTQCFIENILWNISVHLEYMQQKLFINMIEKGANKVWIGKSFIALFY